MTAINDTVPIAAPSAGWYNLSPTSENNWAVARGQMFNLSDYHVTFYKYIYYLDDTNSNSLTYPVPASGTQLTDDSWTRVDISNSSSYPTLKPQYCYWIRVLSSVSAYPVFSNTNTSSTLTTDDTPDSISSTLTQGATGISADPDAGLTAVDYNGDEITNINVTVYPSGNPSSPIASGTVADGNYWTSGGSPFLNDPLTTAAGDYTIRYTATDGLGTSSYLYKKIRILQGAGPTFSSSSLSTQSVTLQSGDPDDVAGLTATDYNGNSLTISVTITNTNTSAVTAWSMSSYWEYLTDPIGTYGTSAGDYTVVYTATDANNESVTLSRTVEVTATGPSNPATGP